MSYLRGSLNTRYSRLCNTGELLMKRYLGDGVYVEWSMESLVLTTENGIGALLLTQPFVKSLVAKLDKAEAENKLLRNTLQDLYDASPASPDSDSLCQAQLAAEKVLGL